MTKTKHATRAVATCIVSQGGGARPQLRTERASAWTLEKQEAFLMHLAVTANIAASLRHVDMSAGGLYKLRKRSAVFRTQWQLALAEGYAVLEARLLDRAINAGPPVLTATGEVLPAVAPISDGHALMLLREHRQSVAATRAVTATLIDDPVRIRKRLIERIERFARSIGRA